MATKPGPWIYRGVLIEDNGVSALWTRTNGMAAECRVVALFDATLLGPERNTWAERDLASVMPRLSVRLRELAKEVSAPSVQIITDKSNNG